MLVTITPIPLPIRKKSTSRVTLRKNGRAIMLSGPEAALWEKEDQLWKLLKEGLKPQLISLCTEHKVDATGTMREMRGRIAPREVKGIRVAWERVLLPLEGLTSLPDM